MIGRVLGHYEIVSNLGQGGMGVVYKARDTKLGRDVAIKVLPEAFAADVDRLARFKREAQVLASLNHPNIAAIYGIEESDSMRALVLELVEGPTLEDLIAETATPEAERVHARSRASEDIVTQRGGAHRRQGSGGSAEARDHAGEGWRPPRRLEIDDALKIARQIIDALEAAHEQGIIHRDLKPANIKVRPDGTVKVLDFGLAKALEAQPAGATAGDISQSPTLTTPAATMMGAILGTAAYMAPEQARGKSADKRADIWAFGVVLYEMLTGRRLFEGEAVTETLGAIIHKEPAWEALPTDTPPAIVELLRRCLAKDPRRRLRDIGDARIWIDDAVAQPVAAAVSAAPSRRTVWLERLALAIVAIALVVAIPFVVAHFREAPPVLSPVRFSIAPPDGTTFAGGPFYAPGATVSPDGRLIVFQAARPGDQLSLLWIRSLESLTARPLPGTGRAVFPFWSPDSRFIAFFADGKLKKMEAAGGAIETLSDAPAGEGGTWNRDGTLVFAATATAGLSRVPKGGGQAVPATSLDTAKKETSHRWPQFLPDGRRFLFLTLPDNAIALGSLDSSEIKYLIKADSKAIYASPGSLLFVRGGTLMAQPFDVASGAIAGEAAPIAERVRYNATNGRAGFSVSENGVLVYRPVDDLPGTPMWVDRNGREVTPLVAAPLQNVANPRLSPDGRRLALIVDGDVWLYDLSGRPPIKLTFDGSHFAPLWTPDGQRIVYESSSPAALRSIPADAIGNTSIDVSNIGHFHPHGWSPAGDMILVQLSGSATAPDIVKMPSGQKDKLDLVVGTAATEGALGAALSPDGRWLAYASDTNKPGQQEIWVQPYPGPGAPKRVSSAGGVEPVWSQDGRTLCYLEGDKVMSVAVAAGAAFDFRPPSLLFTSAYLHGGQPPTTSPRTDGFS